MAMAGNNTKLYAEEEATGSAGCTRDVDGGVECIMNSPYGVVP